MGVFLLSVHVSRKSTDSKNMYKHDVYFIIQKTKLSQRESGEVYLILFSIHIEHTRNKKRTGAFYHKDLLLSN